VRMRKLNKGEIPAVLAENVEWWTEEFVADPENHTKRYRYRHPEIKAALLKETAGKCVYCESKVGHNTPGDTEHKIPSSEDNTLHFSWTNLTIACSECNRRKNDYFRPSMPFLDPYVDDVESVLVHLGPIVGWKPGYQRAEITIRTLELHSGARRELISRKIERLEELSELLERLASSSCDELMGLLLTKRLEEMKSPDAEYSGMVMAACAAVER